MKNDNELLAAMPVRKAFFRLALPAVAAQLINILYNLVDKMFIGHIPGVGKQALAGVGVTAPVILAISAFAALVSMGGAPKASIFMGKGDNEQAEKVMGSCAWMLIVLSVVLTAFMLIFGKMILQLFGASDNTILYATDYMNIYCVGTLFTQLTLGLNAFITAQGKTLISMCNVAVGAVTNIVLDAILINGFGMGVKGAALATVIAQGVSTCFVIHYLIKPTSQLKLRLKNIRFERKLLLPCILLGTSPALMQLTENMVAISFNTSLQKYGGDIAVASMSILTSIMQFVMLLLPGLVQGAQPLLSYNLGAKNISRVKKTFRLLLICCLSGSFLIWLVCMLIPQNVASIFTDDVPLITYTGKSMRIYLAMLLIYGIQVACQYSFVALDQAKKAIFLTIWRKIILLIPLIFILPRILSGSAMEVFLAEPIADTIIDHGVNIEKFTPCREKDNQFAISSQLISRKHIEKSIEAFAKYLNKYDGSAKLYIMGDGDEKENLRKLAKDLGADKNIIFTGKLGHNELIEILKKSIAMLVYTQSDLNMVSIVESLSLATPVITTSVPYCSSYIESENLGIVDDNWNEDDLRRIATSDEYINNCMNYRKYLPTEYKAEQFLKVKGLI